MMFALMKNVSAGRMEDLGSPCGQLDRRDSKHGRHSGYPWDKRFGNGLHSAGRQCQLLYLGNYAACNSSLRIYFQPLDKERHNLIDSIGETLSQTDDNARTKMETSDLCLLLGNILVSALSSWLASILSPMLVETFGKSDFYSANTVTIVLATVAGVVCAPAPLGKVPGSSPVSMTMLYVIICLIASRASFKSFTDAPYYLFAGFVILAIHAVLLALLAKIFKLDLFTCAVASLANIGAVAAAPIIAAAYKETLVGRCSDGFDGICSRDIWRPHSSEKYSQ